MADVPCCNNSGQAHRVSLVLQGRLHSRILAVYFCSELLGVHVFHKLFKVFTSRRVSHGSKNSVSYFRSNMEATFEHLQLFNCLDDMLGPVFEICRKVLLKPNTRKCELAKQVHFFDRFIDSKMSSIQSIKVRYNHFN